MKRGQTGDRPISLCGSFVDKSLESEFFNYDIQKMMKYIKPMVLALGFLYVLYIIPDYFLTKSSMVFKILLVNRLLFFTLIIILFLKMENIKNYKLLSFLISAYEALAIISFLYIYYSYESPNYLIHAFGSVIIILSIFVIPNKFFNMAVLSILLAGGFTLVSLHKFKDMEPRILYAGIVYIIIAIILSSIAACISNYYKRRSYIDNKKLTIMSVTDPLTGIYNRAKFDEEMRKWFDISRRYETPLSLVIFDFDDFKKINDKYGHLEGDSIIIECVDIIKRGIRITDIFARWGGEEFVILLPNTGREYAVELTERLRMMIASYYFKNIDNLTCSFGVAGLEDSDTTDTFLHRADKLLYSAKNTGKNTVAS